MKIFDTTFDMMSSYEYGHFNLEKWKAYTDSSVPRAKKLCLADMQNCLNSGFTWEKDYLPVLNAIMEKDEATLPGLLPRDI